MVSYRWAKQYLGQHIQCHTPYGIFHGVLIKTTKSHVILAPTYSAASGMPASASMHEDYRQYPMGPGPGGPMGPGPGGPGGGGGWHMAIPLAAILGITALGLHWW